MEVKVKDEPSDSDDCSSDLEPKKKRLKRTPLTVSEKEMVVNVYKYLEQSSPQDKRNKTSLHAKTAEILCIGQASVYRVLREKARDTMKAPILTKKRPHCSDKLSESEKSAIRKKVYSFFEKDEIPSGKKVLKAVNDDESLPTFRKTTFHKMMRHLQFKYVRRKARSAVIDKDELVIRRRSYLDRIIECRKGGRPIFYVDEAWINVEATVPKSGTAKNTPKTTRRLNIVHIGNENGFLPDTAEIFETKSKNYEDSMTAEHFEWWFEKTVSKLGDNAVVILDEAPCHSRRIDKIPSNTWTKVSIQDWLRQRDIEFTDEDIKAVLLDKVYKLKLQRRTYAIDEIAKKYNVEVLRVPPFHYELNPMVTVLAEVKEYVAKKKCSTLEDVQKFLKKGIEILPVGKWAWHVERAGAEEIYFYKIDDLVDEVMDRLYNTLDSGSESSDDTGSNSDDD